MSLAYIKSGRINLESAKQLAQAAREEAIIRNLPGSIAIVDSCGSIIYIETWDGSMPAAASIAISKALTAVNFQRPTKNLEEVIVNGRTPMLNTTVKDYAPLKGGYPLVIEGMTIGGVAVSGALTADNDELIALAAIKEFERIKA